MNKENENPNAPPDKVATPQDPENVTSISEETSSNETEGHAHVSDNKAPYNVLNIPSKLSDDADVSHDQLIDEVVASSSEEPTTAMENMSPVVPLEQSTENENISSVKEEPDSADETNTEGIQNLLSTEGSNVTDVLNINQGETPSSITNELLERRSPSLEMNGQSSAEGKEEERKSSLGNNEELPVASSLSPQEKQNLPYIHGKIDESGVSTEMGERPLVVTTQASLDMDGQMSSEGNVGRGPSLKVDDTLPDPASPSAQEILDESFTGDKLVESGEARPKTEDGPSVDVREASPEISGETSTEVEGEVSLESEEKPQVVMGTLSLDMKSETSATASNEETQGSRSSVKMEYDSVMENSPASTNAVGAQPLKLGREMDDLSLEKKVELQAEAIIPSRQEESETPTEGSTVQKKQPSSKKDPATAVQSDSSRGVKRKTERIQIPPDLIGPTASQYSYRERLAEIEDMENTFRERATEAAINVLSQNVPSQRQPSIQHQAPLSFSMPTTSCPDDIIAKIKQLDNKIKTVNRRLQESKREKNQLEDRIGILELEIFAKNNETVISRMLNQTPTEEDLAALERIKETIKTRSERVKVIKDMERRTNVLNKVLESADTFINSLSPVSKYKQVGSADTDTASYEVSRSKSHEFTPATFPKPADIIIFESQENLVHRDSPAQMPTELTRVKSATSDLSRPSRDEEAGLLKALKRKSRSPGLEGGQSSTP